MRSIVRALVVVSISVTLAIGALWAPAPVALAAPPNLSLSVTVIGDS